jgi:two-component sensor histidine kinase
MARPWNETMSEAPWAHRPLPVLASRVAGRWSGHPVTPAEVSGLRRQLRAALRDGPLAVGVEEDVAKLLLAFEELVSNGLRHGSPPVQVAVTADETGWLLEVSDAAVDRLPIPAAGRDPATGGLGLYMVARLCTAHGWAERNGRKQVWCRIRIAAEQAAAATPGDPPHAAA